jgi:hypothetical protein
MRSILESSAITDAMPASEAIKAMSSLERIELESYGNVVIGLLVSALTSHL